ncbi:uncharacterized protein I206_103004 [Kwoniella pini CBS 10737]|uniref:Enoyl reductase (ER) domain-containing protein n=1 Tax=Kwoniella pini CBS 10737 TaxID=1296096 RepID=A0A1B9IBB0_9TREE|nr:uncharacterized protein I206_01990 [Kwoniella pini CBS 10737]OCF52697.1 hypothetical protein I206_01990 [Kwoniella pini CBS 10737]
MTTTTATVVQEATTPRRVVHRALLARIPPKGQSAWQLSNSHTLPAYEDHQILIKTSYVALNPFDWQGVAFKYAIGEEAKVMGRDGAGEIVGLGKAVKNFQLGDRVWFCANSSASHTGAFQEYSVHSAAEVGHTPDHLSDEEAATLGTGLITAGVALFRTLGLPLDSLKVNKEVKREKNAPWVLIWGGAGITGVYLIEIARLLGYRIICSASAVNHEYIKSLGADVVLDRWSEAEGLVEQIRKETNDDVRIAIDNVGSTTASLCQQVLRGSASWRKAAGIEADSDDQEESAKLVPLAGSPKLSIDTEDMIRKVEPLRISFSTTFYGHPEFSRALLDRFDELLSNKLLSPARIRLVEGGLHGIEKGLEDLRHGRVQGGYKLVARLSDTPAQTTVTLKRDRISAEAEVRTTSEKRTRSDTEQDTPKPKRVKEDIDKIDPGTKEASMNRSVITV